MVDLEAGPDPEPVDALPAVEPVSETVSVAEPAPASEAPPKLEDLYDFDDPTIDKPDMPAETPSVPAAGEPATPTPAAAPVISDALAQRAAAMGYTPEVIATFKDPIQLEAVVRTSENVAMQAMRFAQTQQPPQPVAQPVQQPVQQLPPAPAPFDEAGLRKQYADMNYDEGLANVLVGQAKQNHELMVQTHQFAVRIADQDRYNRESQQFMQQQQTQFQQIQAAHQKELIDRDYESFKSSLPEPVQKLVSTPEAKAQIHSVANALLMGMQQTGQQLPSNPVAFKQAMYAALGDKIHQAATETVRQEVKTHQARATTRPSSGGSQPRTAPKGPEAAGRFLEDFFQKNGWPSTDSSQIEV